MGYQIPFLSMPPLSEEPIPHFILFPFFHQGESIGGGNSFAHHERCSRASSSPFSRLLQPCVRGVEDLRVVETCHRPLYSESLHPQDSIQDGDSSVGSSFGASRRLYDLSQSQRRLLACSYPSRQLQVSEVKAFGRPYQFRALCFGLSTAPQVFTRVMAPVSTFFHRLGIRVRRYLDDRLVQAQLQSLVLQALETVLSLCRELGIVINPAKSNLVPSQWVLYLGTMIDSVSFKASPSQPRVEKLLSLGEEFLSFRRQPESSWRVLLGTLSSMPHLVPGGRLRLLSLQLTLHHSWDQVDNFFLVRWDDRCLQDLSWWLDPVRLQEGVSLGQVSPNLDFWSDPSDVGWGAHLG